jgi:hypothetical protein
MHAKATLLLRVYTLPNAGCLLHSRRTTWSSSVACAYSVCVNYYVTKYHITTTLVTLT